MSEKQGERFNEGAEGEAPVEAADVGSEDESTETDSE